MGLALANSDASWRTWGGASGGAKLATPNLTAITAVRPSLKLGYLEKLHSPDVHPLAVGQLTSVQDDIMIDCGRSKPDAILLA